MQARHLKFAGHLKGLVLALLTTWMLPAQEQLDLHDYLSLVSKENLDLKQSDSRLRIAGREVKAARSALFPEIGASANYQRDFNSTFLFINDFDEFNRFRTNFNNSIDAGIVLEQTLFDPAIFLGLKIVKLSEELSKITYENASRELIYEASRLYWQTVLTKESIAVFQENSDLAKEQLEQLQELYDKGMVSLLDVQRAQALLQQTKPLVSNARNQYSVLINELKSMANIDFKKELVLIDSIGMVVSTEPEPALENLDGQPQLQALETELKIAKKHLQLKKSYWFPKLNLSGGFNYNAQDNNFRFGNNSNKLFYGGLSLNIPLFSSGRNKAEIAKASLHTQIAEINSEKIRNQLEKEIRNARIDLANALERIALQTEAIDLNRSEIEVYKKQLQLGVVTSLEFKESRLRLMQSRLKLLSAHLEVLIARLQLRRILGSSS